MRFAASGNRIAETSTASVGRRSASCFTPPYYSHFCVTFTIRNRDKGCPGDNHNSGMCPPNMQTAGNKKEGSNTTNFNSWTLTGERGVRSLVEVKIGTRIRAARQALGGYGFPDFLEKFTTPAMHASIAFTLSADAFPQSNSMTMDWPPPFGAGIWMRR